MCPVVCDRRHPSELGEALPGGAIESDAYGAVVRLERITPRTHGQTVEKRTNPQLLFGFFRFSRPANQIAIRAMTQSDCQTGRGFERGCWIAQPGTHTRTRASRTRPENRNRPTNEMAAMLSTSAFVGQRVVAAKTAAKVRPPISPEENLTFPMVGGKSASNGARRPMGPRAGSRHLRAGPARVHRARYHAPNDPRLIPRPPNRGPVARSATPADRASRPNCQPPIGASFTRNPTIPLSDSEPVAATLTDPPSPRNATAPQGGVQGRLRARRAPADRARRSRRRSRRPRRDRPLAAPSAPRMHPRSTRRWSPSAPPRAASTAPRWPS